MWIINIHYDLKGRWMINKCIWVLKSVFTPDAGGVEWRQISN